MRNLILFFQKNKRILSAIFIVFTALFLSACEDVKVVSVALETKAPELVLFEGEDLDLDDFVLRATYSDGSEKLLDLWSVKFSTTYNPNPAFDHFDIDDTEVVQEVTLDYKRVTSNPVYITTKRLVVSSFELFSYGQDTYQYGDRFDVADYSLFVRYQNHPNQVIPLNETMVDLPNLMVTPNTIGRIPVEIYYNGVAIRNPLMLQVLKHDQTLNPEAIEIISSTTNHFAVTPVLNAEYAFLPTGVAPEASDWQEEPYALTSLTESSYTVHMRLPETDVAFESNAVSKDIMLSPTIYDTPNILFVGQTHILVEKHPHYTLHLSMPEAIDTLGEAQIETMGGQSFYRVNHLIPNQRYTLYFGENGQIIEEAATTFKMPERDNVFIFQNKQITTYSGQEQEFAYNINLVYTNPYLLEHLNPTFTYYAGVLNEQQQVVRLNNEPVEPVDAGLYVVELSHAFSQTVADVGSLVIQPKALFIPLINQQKHYLDTDPEIITDYNHYAYGDDEFVADITRDEGEVVGTYTISGTLTNPNYAITTIDSTFTIQKRPVTVTLDLVDLVYGETLQSTTYTMSEALIFLDELTPAEREVSVSFYRMHPELTGAATYQNEVSAHITNSQYEFHIVKAPLMIHKRLVSVLSVEPSTKVYGNPDPTTFVYTLSEEAYRDELNLTLGRTTSNVNAGTYYNEIGIINYDNTNLDVVMAQKGTLTITKRPLTATLNNETIIYGDQYPTFSWTSNDFAYDDHALSLEFNTEYLFTTDHLLAVGIYPLQATIQASNYEITTIVQADVEIVPRNIDIILPGTTYTKIYGDADQVFAYTVNNFPLGGIPLEGELGRIPGESVGTYQVTEGTLSNQNGLNQNYVIHYEWHPDVDQLLITPKTVLVQPSDDLKKTYGDLDPNFTYTIPALLAGDETDITGALSRENGEAANQTYAYNLGTLSAGDNYILELAPGVFSIERRTTAISYQNYTNLVYQNAHFPITAFGLNLRVGDEVVITNHDQTQAGQYEATITIVRGLEDVTENYMITNPTLAYEIAPRPITISALNQSKIYGENDPLNDFSITSGAVATGDILAVTYTRTVGQTVLLGGYEIIPEANLDINNYEITYVSGTLTIHPATLTITPNDHQTKVYGTPVETFTYQAEGFQYADSLVIIGGRLDRQPGENVGTYSITAGTLTAGNNYTIDFVEDVIFSITPRAITITYFNYNHLVYQNQAFNIEAQATSLRTGDALVLNDHQRIDAGTHEAYVTITRGLEDMTANYTITNETLAYTIAPRFITLSVDEKTKVYGDNDPAFTYLTTSGSLAVGDTQTISMAREQGESVDTYAITLTTDLNPNNYAITIENNTLSITKRTLTLTPNDNQGKIYGHDDLSLSFTVNGLQFEEEVTDVISGALVRVAGESVGNYLITQGTIEADQNYQLVFIDTINYAITSRATDILYGNHTNLIYQNDSFNITAEATNLRDGDTIVFGGHEERNAGTYTTTLQIVRGLEDVTANYTITNQTLTYEIAPRQVVFTAVDHEKTYGELDPEFTFNQTGTTYHDFVMMFSRELGENVKANDETYTISLLTNDLDLNNYDIEYVTGTFTITPRTLTITPHEEQAKIYGELDQVFTYDQDGLVSGDVIFGELAREAGENVSTYTIIKNNLDAGTNYHLIFVEDVLFSITPRPITVTANDIQSIYGDEIEQLTHNGNLALVLGDEFNTVFSGSLVTTAENNSATDAGQYVIAQGTLLVNGNYDMTFVEGIYTIARRVVTVTPDNKVKQYGENDPVWTYTFDQALAPWTTSYNVSMTRQNGLIPNDYDISVAYVSLNPINYDVRTSTGTLTIIPRDVEVTYLIDDNLTYGIDYDITPIPNRPLPYGHSFIFTDALGMVAGSHTNHIDIVDNGVSVAQYYRFLNDTEEVTYEIGKATLRIYPQTKNKTYGNVDPFFNYTNSPLYYGDTLSGALSREDLTNQNVGSYQITYGSLNVDELSANYHIILDEKYLNIQPLTVHIVYDIDNRPLVYSGLTHEDRFLVETIENLPYQDYVVLTNVTGINAGLHEAYAAILNNNDVDVSNNYTIVNPTYDYVIEKATLTVSIASFPGVQYNQASPVFTSTVSGFVNNETMAVLETVHPNGLVYYTPRELTSPAGEYPITLAQGYRSDNYRFEIQNGTIVVTPATILFALDELTHTYDATTKNISFTATDPHTFELIDLTGAVELSVTYRLNGQIVNNPSQAGLYEVTLDWAGDSSYGATFVIDTMVINPKELIVTAHENQSKIYGDLDLEFTYDVVGRISENHEASGALARVVGENTGTYALTVGDLSFGSNYSITFETAPYTIDQREITISYADYLNLIYNGQAHEIDVTVVNLYGLDELVVYENNQIHAGNYTITIGVGRGGVDLTANYIINNNQLAYTIAPQEVIFEAVNQTKTYGNADPVNNYILTGPTYDLYDVTYTRVAGENIGEYIITPWVNLSTNDYAITYETANLTITPRTLTITPNEAQSKVYGDQDPVYEYTSSGLVFEDEITGLLNRVNGETVDHYFITAGDLDAGENYTIDFVDNVTFAITRRSTDIVYAGYDNLIYQNASFDMTAAATNLRAGDVLVIHDHDAIHAGEYTAEVTMIRDGVDVTNNYLISNPTQVYEIQKREIIFNVVSQSRIYGEADPINSYQVIGLTFDDFTVEYDRAEGEDIGNYVIEMTTNLNVNNYAITYNTNNLTITPRTLTITPNEAQSKVYGDHDPVYAYTSSGLVFDDKITGDLSRVIGENVNAYAITAGDIDAGANYTINFVSDVQFTITTRSTDINYDGYDNLVYQNASFNMTAEATNLRVDDVLVLSNHEAINAGEYTATVTIMRGLEDVTANYDISNPTRTYEIAKREVIFTVDPQTKTYGDADPVNNYQQTGTTYHPIGEIYTRENGKDVGEYVISMTSTLDTNNYAITYVTANLIIEPKAITVTIQPQTSDYGVGFNVLTETTDGLVENDKLTGSLEVIDHIGMHKNEHYLDVGIYQIKEGTRTAGANYEITWIYANYTIEPASVLVSPIIGQSEEYGEAIIIEFVAPVHAGNNPMGALALDDSGLIHKNANYLDVGSYEIIRGDLNFGDNYTITFEAGRTYAITPKAITLTYESFSYVYDNNLEAITFMDHISLSEAIIDDNDFVMVFKHAMNDVGIYLIDSYVEADVSENYLITYAGLAEELEITPRTLTVTPTAAQAKTYGNNDPAEYVYTYEGLVPGDFFTGALSRVMGENVNTYLITQGNLSAGDNYTIDFVDDVTFEITRRTTDVDYAGYDNLIYQNASFNMTAVATNLRVGDVLVLNDHDEINAGDYTALVTVTRDGVDVTNNYNILTPEQEYTIAKRAITVAANLQTKVYGNAEPVYTSTITGSTFDDYTLSHTREAGEDVDHYIITPSIDLDIDNYAITYVTSELSITKKTLTITPTAGQTKVYGNNDPVYAYTQVGLVSGDSINGSLGRDAGEDVNTYEITQGSIEVSDNYNLVFIEEVTFQITKRNPNVTYSGYEGLVYNSESFDIEAVAASLRDGDVLVLSGHEAINAGSYTASIVITRGGVDVSSNYDISNPTLAYTIAKQNITLTVDSQTKVYGDNDPENGYNLTSGFIYDGHTVSYSRVAGEDVASYAISMTSTLDTDNYAITYVSAPLTITKATLTVTPDANQTKVYGDQTPALTYTVTGFKLQDDEAVLSGSLAIDSENVGQQDFITSSFAADNYHVVIGGNAKFEITHRSLTVVYIDYQGLVYKGSAHNITVELAPTFTLRDGDILDLTGHTAINAGNHTASVKITRGGNDVTSNYNISNAEQGYSIAKKDITASQNDLTYSGVDMIPTFILSGVVGEDNVIVTTITTVKNAGTYNNISVSLSGTDIGNYNLTNQVQSVVVEKATLVPQAVYATDYTDNSVKNYTVAQILALMNLSHFATDLIIDNEIDLSNGGTTVIVNVKNNTANIELLDKDVIFKFKSVTIGNNTTFYTIEDALYLATSGTIIVKYNTSFAESDVANIVYGTNEYNIKAGLNLVIPYSGSFNSSANYIFNQATSGSYVNRAGGYSKLFITANVSIDVYGQVTIGARTGFANSNGGFVDGANYGELELANNVSINLQANSEFLSYGFTYGNGTILALDGSKVTETAVLSQFRGGTVSTGIASHIFPFDIYNFNSIEAKIIFNQGANYEANTHAVAGGTAGKTVIPIISSGSNSIFEIKSGIIIKTFDKGIINFDLVDSEIHMNNISVNPGVQINTQGKFLPLPGLMNIHAINTNLEINVNLKLLPGLYLYIDSDSSFIINESANVHIYSENEYDQGSSQSYYYIPQNWTNTYRENPTNITFANTDSANVEVDGIVVVKGGLTGEIKSPSGEGFINLVSGFRSYVPVERIIGLGKLTKPYFHLLDSSGNHIEHSGLYQINQNGQYTQKIKFVDYLGNVTYENQVYGSLWNLSKNTEINYGWFNGSGEQVINSNRFYGVENFELFEQELANSYEYVFESNGGTQFDNLLIENSTITDFNNSHIPEKAGHVFLGWYYDDNFAVAYDKSLPIIESNTLFARYAKGNIVINIVASSSKISNKTGKITFTIEIRDDDGPLKNILLVASATNATSNNIGGIYQTNNEGKVVLSNVEFKFEPATGSNEGDIQTIFHVMEITSNQYNHASYLIDIHANASPFLYSVDSEGNLHFEHEPISHSMIKTVESTTYGTLRLMQGIDGIYYIEIVEEGTSATMLNGANVFYFDYETNNEIIDFFLDVYGNPHTIKERIAPTSFVDHENNSYLEEITNLDGLYATFSPFMMDTVGYYIATFDRPNSNNAKFMIAVKDNSGTLEAFEQILASFNAHRNLWWLDRAFMNSEIDTQLIQNLFDSLLIRVEVWDGENWIYQGSIQRGTYLMEEFLVELNLENIHTQDLQVRLTLPGQAGYIIDRVSIDYSINAPMTFGVMTLESALLNGLEDVYQMVVNDQDDLYVQLYYKDAVRMGFSAPELAEGYTRSFGVNMSGYIYAEGVQVEDELEEEMIGKSFEEIKQIIIDSGRQDLIDDIALVEEFYYGILFIGSLDYETILDFLFGPEE
ncbi:MAG: MBG domain-containing protein [Acholeplasmataceae bacterium]|nr:InlB B-repeat-containing protein [Acholeplasmataceae bacterium]